MDYQQSITWLFSTQAFGIKPGLENISRLLGTLALPAHHPHILHVAGTNGKGSTCAFAESLCREHGLRTGLFTSPHLVKANERIRIDFQPISDGDFVELTRCLRSTTEGWEPHPTFFELILAMALLHFRHRQVDVAILETGMGGRLDATNAITPTSAAISRIGLDHTQWLGETIAAIAKEKAGILKPGIPLSLGPQEPAAAEVIIREARQIGCPVTMSKLSDQGTTALVLTGRHQQENAALATRLVANSGIALDPGKVIRALARTSWPARFQIIHLPDRHHPVIIDGAHNPAAASALAETWKQRFPETRATLLFASLKGKDAVETFRPLSTIAEHITVTEADTTRSTPSGQLAAALQQAFPQITETLDVAADPIAAINGLLAADSRPILVAGSLFLAGKILAQFQHLPHQASLQ